MVHVTDSGDVLDLQPNETLYITRKDQGGDDEVMERAQKKQKLDDDEVMETEFPKLSEVNYKK